MWPLSSTLIVWPLLPVTEQGATQVVVLPVLSPKSLTVSVHWRSLHLASPPRWFGPSVWSIGLPSLSSTPAAIFWSLIDATVTVKTPPLPPSLKLAQLPL